MLGSIKPYMFGKYQKDLSIYSIMHNTGSFMLEDSLHELQWLGIEKDAIMLREQFSSGFMKNFTINAGYENFFSITSQDGKPLSLLVDGYVLQVGDNEQDTSIPVGMNRTESNLIFKLSSINSTARTDLVILEAWFEVLDHMNQITKFGGDTTQIIANGEYDQIYNIPKINKIQFKWRVRVVNNRSSMSGLTALRYNKTDSGIAYTQLGNVYVAETGSQTVNNVLKTPGVVYGIPLFTVTRTSNDIVNISNITNISPKVDSNITSQTTQNQIDSLFNFMYTPPTAVLNTNPNVSAKEYGDNMTSVTLTATTSKKIMNISKVEFYKNSTLVNTVSSPKANGGDEIYTDNSTISDTINYSVKVYDERGSSETIKTISYVYPFYIGNVSVANPNQTQIKALTKLVKTKSNTTQAFSLNNARFCIAYPKSYGALTSILDKNSFETIGLYTVTTVSVTGLNSTAVDYYVYTLSNITTQSNFTNTFKF